MASGIVLEKRIGQKVKNAPRVSVIIPAYNVGEFVSQTLDSVFAQHFTDYEVIIVNDGSPDTEDFERVLAPYYEKIIYIKQENGGASVARNTAIDHAKGEIFAFLDGDDIWMPHYLESQLAALEEKKCDLIYCDAYLSGSLLNRVETYMEKSPSDGRVSTESLISGDCNVITSGTVARREAVLAAGPFDPDLPRMQDFDLWFRMAHQGARLDYQKKILLTYRVRPDSLSGSNVQRAERNIRALNVIAHKYELNESEKKILEKQLEFARAELAVEKAKLEIIQENFSAAESFLREANKYYRKPKFSLLIFLLKVRPHLVLRFFKHLRPAEFSFIAPDRK